MLNIINDKKYFLFGQIVTAFIGLIVGKIIAININPADFGVYSIQFGVFTLVFSFLISPFIQFFKQNINTLFPKIGIKNFAYLFAVLLLISILIFFGSINIFKSSINNYLFLIITLSFLMYSTSNGIADYINIKSKFILLTINSITKQFVSLVFLLIVFYHLKAINNSVELLWELLLISSIAGTIPFYLVIKENFKGRYELSFKKFIRKYLAFAYPLMFLAIWSWMNNYFDRYVIEKNLNDNAVGIYNASYSLGSKFFILLNPFFLSILTPIVYSSISNKQKKNTIQKYVKFYFLLSIPLLIIIYFTTDLVGSIFLAEEYKDGFYIIFWIALSYFILTTIFLYETLFYYEGKTKIILYSNIISAIFTVVINLILIPILGLNGAVIATIFAFTIRFLFVYNYFNKIARI